MKHHIIYHEIVRCDINPGPPTKFNTSFCPAETLPQPVERTSETPYAFSRWLSLIAASRGLADKDLQIVHLSRAQARVIVNSSTASIITGGFSRAHWEDLEETVFPSFAKLRFPSSGRGLFMRLDGCSPKDATCRLHGGGGDHPQAMVLSARDVVLRLVTSQRATNDLTKALECGLTQIPVFFLPFNSRMKSSREYRVFCVPRSGDISAISQYNWHQPWKLRPTSNRASPGVSSHEHRIRITQCAKHWRRVIMDHLDLDHDAEHRLLLEQGFSFDLFYDEDSRDAQLVELNVFGARSGLGSCLFKWVDDFDILYGNEEPEFRVTY